jgi:RNA polymerase sigma-70 factor (ECF subfamily)
MDDLELARRCARGESRAWEALVRDHVDAVWRIVRRVLADEADAEDVVQTVFVKLLDDDGRRLRSFEGRCRLSTWLVAVARREALEFAEKKGRAALPPAGDLDKLATELRDDPAVSAEEGLKLQSALDRLPARDGLLVRLIYMDGVSYEQAARFLAVPLNSISPWLGRAKDRLKSLLGEDPRGCTEKASFPLQ